MLSVPRVKGTQKAAGLGRVVSLAVLALASLAGGLTVVVTLEGRSAPTSASMAWLAVFLGSSLLLAAWGILYAFGLTHRAGIPATTALYLSALCHLPLLLGLGLVCAVYSDDLANHVYSASVYGRVAYRPLALGGVVAAPVLLQAVVAALQCRQRAVGYLAVAAPVAVGLALRLWTIDWQLPYQLHNDEQNYLGVAMIAWAHGDPNPHRFLNPSLLAYVDVALYLLLGGAQAETFRVFAEAFGRHVWDPKGFYLIFLAARGVVALLGTATVPVVYLAGRELFNRKTGLFAAWLLAVSFLHVRNSHYATNDVAATFFAAASFLCAAKLYRSGRRRHYVLAGLLGGLATATKYNAGLFVLPLLVAHLARQERPRLRGLLQPRELGHLLTSGTAAVFGFVLGVPYSILDPGEFAAGFREQLRIGSEPWFGQQLLPTWWMHLATLVQGFGLLPLLLAGLGVLILLRRAPGPLAVAAAFPAGYYAFMAGQQLFFARFDVPMIPFVALLAGFGMAWAADWLRRPPEVEKPLGAPQPPPTPFPPLGGRAGDRGLSTAPWTRLAGRLLVPGLLALALIQPAVYSVQSDLILGREDTRVLADRWISANVPDQGILLVDDISDLRPNQPWPSRPGLPARLVNLFTDPAPWRHEPRRPVYVAISSFGYEGFLRGTGDPTGLPDPYREVEQEGHQVAFFSPTRGQGTVGYAQDDTYTPFWYVMDRERSGPTIRIYRMDPGP